MKRFNHITKRFVSLLLMVSITLFAFATIGDGKNKSKKSTAQVKSAFSALKSNTNFTLKSGFNYRGSMLLGSSKIKKVNSSYNSLIAYQKGNSTYILPYRYKVPSNNKMQAKSNLQLINLKLNIPH
jgi:hypothetical protein